MPHVQSQDGTRIAYDTFGRGPTLIYINGALSHRKFAPIKTNAETFAAHFTVYCYDRRGRGDSSDTPPYAVAREIEDIAALINISGGPVYLYGHSSGATLALEAALSLGNRVSKLALYEPPYSEDEAAQSEALEFTAQLKQLLADNQRGSALELWLQGTGMPQEIVTEMRASPEWSTLESLAPTLVYDATLTASLPPVARLGKLSTPTLIMVGEQSFSFMANVAQTLCAAIPLARYHLLSGQGHTASPETVTPLLVEFFSGSQAS
jgi:pimeloyl-ACP methyl ester carboxylesterase